MSNFIAFLPTNPLGLFKAKALQCTPVQHRRICRLADGQPRGRRHHAPQANQRAERETDARGFVLPQQGDVVLYQGRWPSEDEAGLVLSVQLVTSRSVHIVDIQTLRRVSSDLFAVPRATRKPSSKWLDVAEVRVVPDAKYVPSQDAYRVLGTRDGYAPVPKINPSDKAAIDAEYARLQASMLRQTAIIGVLCSILPLFVGKPNLSLAYGLGASASLLYLALLQRAVDAVGKPSPLSRLLPLRFAVPVLPFILLAVLEQHQFSSALLFGSLSKPDALAIVLGLLTYKAPLFWRTGGEFVDGMADIELGKTGMLGTAAALTARQIQKRRDNKDENVEIETPKASRPVLVFSGPSGAGKGTLMNRLFQEFPTRFQFCVSHTTRPKRDGEVDGREYHFVTKEQFEQMITEEKLVEYAEVHGNYYGSSFSAVNEVLSSGRTCVLDVDVQGIESIRAKDLALDSRFVWIAPPSLTVLEERLRKRGSESESSIKKRLETAMRELSYAATKNVFDVIIVNDNVETAFEELCTFVERCSREWRAD